MEILSARRVGRPRDGRAVRDARREAEAAIRTRRGVLLEPSSPQDRITGSRSRGGAHTERRTRDSARVSIGQGCISHDVPISRPGIIAEVPNRLAAEQSPVSPPAQGQSRSTGTRGATRRSTAARRENKPIFLSIGYSTCHWCHVMEHESFENPEIAEVLNRALRVDQGRSRGAAGRRPRLHDVRAGHDRIRRLADERVAHAVAASRSTAAPTSRRRRRWGRPGLRRHPRGDRARLARGARARSSSRRRRSSSGFATLRRSDGGAATCPAPARSSARSASSPRRSTRGAAGSATRRSFRGRASCCSCCASTREPARPSRATWCSSRCARWRSAACATTSAAASTATRWTATGACRTSRRCSTTRRSSCSPISKPRR